MEKSKLGISIPLTGAALFFTAMISPIISFLLAAFILMKEDDEWLRKSVIKMAYIVIVGYAGAYLIGTIADVLSLLSFPYGLTSFIDELSYSIIPDIRAILLLIFGMKAMTKGTVNSNVFNKIINKHM